MWSGAINSIPAGWALCDGSTVNEHVTPDLRGRFVLPAGSGAGLTPRTVGQTGGAETHTLTTDEMPIHSHGVTDNGHNHTVNDAGHTHAITDPGHAHAVTDPGHDHGYTDVRVHGGLFSNRRDLGGLSHEEYETNPKIDGGTTTEKTTGISINSSFTGISINSAGTGISNNSSTSNITIANNGSGHAHNNMPPYYVLAYIMRVQ